ncbi:hypothetical protein SAMN05216215_10128 [Saccharopolyspora shandongensis]|uniref:Uncharacterized protein n=1 Tax=Saccharopolyspora shandongensis TaxID=418495 RepID=A0A1H3CEU6_9PSEU|nr:hypothetical protein [Saccharopolyspora shandongensis]SDX52653.1 hypothetical protein SAMN05216215_10128 [Saccharopolyspora shandongensis]
MTTTDRLDEIKARAAAATPGPWGWFGNTDVRHIYLSTKYWGRQIVMDFARWGMQSARPRFADGRTFSHSPQSWHDFGSSGLMADADQIARFEVAPNAHSRKDPAVYRADISGIRNPDATFIEHSRADIDWLVAEVERLRAAIAAVRKLHQPDEYGNCPACGVDAYEDPIPCPCVTVRALDEDPVAAS